MEGSCVSLFNGCDDPTDFLFSTSAAALSASAALLAQVFVNGPSSGPEDKFDNHPNWTAGCTSGLTCIAITPYERADPGLYFATGATNSDLEINDRASQFSLPPTYRTDEDAADAAVFAVWSRSTPAHVPEPTSVFLAGLGLLATWRASRRKST